MKVNQVISRGYEAFVLDENTRKLLAEKFPPKYPEWIGHHITNIFGVQKDDARPYGQQYTFVVVGYVEDDGIEALVVERDGSSKRPDGKIYHITWSLDRTKGWKPVDSNRIIAQGPIAPVDRVTFKAPLMFLR